MKPFRYSSERGHRLGLVLILLGGIAATGCDSGGNVLTPPEGGSTVNEAKAQASQAQTKYELTPRAREGKREVNFPAIRFAAFHFRAKALRDPLSEPCLVLTLIHRYMLRHSSGASSAV